MSPHSLPPAPAAYRTLDTDGIRAFLAGVPTLATRLGGPAAHWRIREVSDGNLNNVFLIDGPQGGVCFKQSLPHVRVDPAWKMPLDRTFYEAAYLREIRPCVGALTTDILHFDPDLFVLVVESLDRHVVLRRGLMAGGDWPDAARAVGAFVARGAFHTSLLAAPFEEITRRLDVFSGNRTLTRITVDLVLTDPYRDHPRNHWISPDLDGIAADIRTDPHVRRRVGAMQARFLTCRQALLHGDLHTGSVMVADDDTRVIDGEFACPGPIGFDCGLFIGNLLLHLFACGDSAGQDRAVRDIAQFWASFHDTFGELWRTATRHDGNGDAYAAALFRDDPSGLQQAQADFMRDVTADTIAFAAMEIIRRIVGYAHVPDFDTIPDRAARAGRQAAALALARDLLADPDIVTTIADLESLARGRAR
ncbi:methylthioribose kinase [Gluconacetobacter johannae DSM 13595]|uniref:S-methyl-5-thioribose kinase n=1 Tax=Gluconacetobacter johannae TaxID=112140 RepID=A0A7W4J981_9PROT|nr:S-methyl-5-thioribose kinase [Gluconacetobacter johannae]MBB2176931.1 S-methyl-5-thioribose kinase [Gluconacetobacter johannae]GBQ89589.1 methylthioribose kinase [Gluconacetobacter johannae DSM 13595]